MSSSAKFIFYLYDNAFEDAVLCNRFLQAIPKLFTELPVASLVLCSSDIAKIIHYAMQIKADTDSHNIALLSNQLEASLQADLDGLEISHHSSENAKKIRTKLGNHKILGVRCKTLHDGYHWGEQEIDYVAFHSKKNELITRWMQDTTLPLIAYNIENANDCQRLVMQNVDFLAPHINIFNHDNFLEQLQSYLPAMS